MLVASSDAEAKTGCSFHGECDPNTTEHKRGPRVVLVVLLAISSARLLAHDPGLSSLEVTVTGTRVTAVLSVAAPDLDALSLGPLRDPLTVVRQLAVERIAVIAHGQLLPASVDRAWRDEDTAHVRLRFAGVDLAHGA